MRAYTDDACSYIACARLRMIAPWAIRFGKSHIAIKSIRYDLEPQQGVRSIARSPTIKHHRPIAEVVSDSSVLEIRDELAQYIHPRAGFIAWLGIGAKERVFRRAT